MRTIKFRFWRDNRLQSAHQLNAYVNTDNNFAGDGEVLMMSTGNKDSNGKEVFEGDILKCFFTGDLYKVMYGEFSISHDFTGIGFYLLCNDGELESLSLYKKSVIGNIYENPELIK